MMRPLWIMTALLTALALGVVAQTPPAPAPIDYDKMGQALMNGFVKGSIEEYYPILAPDAVAALSPETVQKISAELASRLGTFKGLRVAEKRPTGQFNRVSYEGTFEKGKTSMIVVLEGEDRIARILLPDLAAARPARPAAPATAAPATATPTGPDPTARPATEIKTALQLPFLGKWRVLNGGSGSNRHAASRAARYGYDFAIVGIDERRFKTDGRKNEDYYAFGKDIYAPAGGVIAQVVDGVEDNTPGQINPYFALGNLVVIDHQNGEFSVLAHLAKGSIKVKERQKVKAGDPLGSCGNSGDSMEPHVHYHLQDQPLLVQGSGLPVVFQHYFSGNRPVETGAPEYGESVSGQAER